MANTTNFTETRETVRRSVLNFNQRKFNAAAFTNNHGVNVSRIEIGDSILLQETTTTQCFFRVTAIKLGSDFSESFFAFSGGRTSGKHILAIEKAQRFAAAA